jgi:hypothetical protein
LPKGPDARRPGRAAVNALRTLLERHNHIVQEVDGQNDFGEDLHVPFTDDGEVTGDLVNATKQLLSARRHGEVLKTITVGPEQKLPHRTSCSTM